jgi:hypothetical protein
VDAFAELLSGRGQTLPAEIGGSADTDLLRTGVLADPRIAYITADRLLPTPFATAYEIDDAVPFSVKRLRALQRSRDVGTLTVKKRGSAVDVDRLRRDLRPSGSGSAVLVVARVGTDPVALLCRPALP